MADLKYRRPRLNTAQALLVSLGVHDLRLFAGHRGRAPSFTKRGPGRSHCEGGDGAASRAALRKCARDLKRYIKARKP